MPPRQSLFQNIEHAIRDTRDQQSFIQCLLVDALGWQLDERAKDIEDISFDWTASDLRAEGLDQKIADGTIRQLRPTTETPWGIFLVEFNHPDAFTTGRGMTGPLRRILRGLVPSKRKASHLASFQREHLLFICTHGYQYYRFAYFKSPPKGSATAPLAAFGWGPGDPIRTLCEFNLPALDWPHPRPAADAWIAHWAQAFDVEKVTKRFYEDYAEVFEKVEEIIARHNKVTGEELRLFTQTLFNRLMFLRFIERKHWLEFEGRHDYLRALFAAPALRGKSFYAGRLQTLFFKGLAIEGEQQSEAIGRVPFLNGGLFESTELDAKVKEIPDTAFAPIIGADGLFYRYNFTVEESTPLDIEVAVDPEMLGKVFEELVTGRHESGSYYTPRPVVSFMCREALKGFLGERTKAPPEAIATLVDQHDVGKLKETHAREILAALDDLKAVDPACGSGAYLLGLMQEMIGLYRLLYSERLIKDARSLYDLKLRIISQNLYGVDIDPFATNIAKLRLWLSLAVEADRPLPLPNLDFKIETGDSLLAPDPQEMPNLFRVRLQHGADVLAMVKNQFFLSHGDEKEGYRKTIVSQESSLRKELAAEYGEGVVDWRIQFAEAFVNKRGGFDVVLANPPYGLLNKRQNQKMGFSMSPKAIADLKRSNEFEPVLRGMVNVCTLFIRRSFSILRPSGVFVEIFPLAFTCDWSYAPLRSFLLKFHTISQVEAFPERDDPNRRVFASAKMSVCILVAKQGRSTSKEGIRLRIHDTPSVDVSRSSVSVLPSEISQFDSNCSIPLVSQHDIDSLRQIYSNSVRLSELGNCFTGEVDLTLCREFISSDPRKAPMHKGAIIDCYRIRTTMSQGEIEYLDAKAYLKVRGAKATSSAWHHKDPRIVLQGITGVNEKRRLKMTYIGPGAFCANSANYIRLHDASRTNYLFTLALLNSDVANFVFKCFSTNSNVNGYEVNNLPIARCTNRDKEVLASLAERCLNANGAELAKHQVEIESLVRRLYGIAPEIKTSAVTNSASDGRKQVTRE